MQRNGFTLIEIMIVVAIIGLLVALAVPAFLKNRRDANGQACAAQIDHFYSAIEQLAFKRDLDGSRQGVFNANEVNAYLRGLDANNRTSCPAGGTYTFNSTYVNSHGIVYVPVCSMENLDPDGDGITYAQAGLHVHRRSCIRNTDGRLSRNTHLAFADGK